MQQPLLYRCFMGNHPTADLIDRLTDLVLHGKLPTHTTPHHN
jgi:hypothetical protein